MITSMTRTRERIGRLDVLLTLAATALGVVLMLANMSGEEPVTRDVSWVALPAFFAVTTPLLWRSVAPLRALLAVLAALLLHGLIFGSLVRCGATIPVLGLLAFSAAARLERGAALQALGIAIAAGFVMAAWDAIGFDVVTAAVPLALICWGLGRVAYSRGQLAEELRERGEQLRVARDERARLDVSADRAAISADLQSLVEARLGQLATLAEQGPDAPDARSATALLVDIETGSRETLEQMRELVGVLRDDAGHAPVAPQPSLTSLEALLMRSEGAGAQLTIEGSPRALPPAVELSAYRVTEQLLHALDDAEGVQVGVRFEDDTLVLSVSGAAKRRMESGAAMQRARERVQLHRGSLQSVVRGGRAELTASLPVHTAIA